MIALYKGCFLMNAIRQLSIITMVLILGCSAAIGIAGAQEAIIADHSVVREIYEGRVPESAIRTAKDQLRIAYGHTSHGSQIISGMDGLTDFVNANNDSGERFHNRYSENLFAWSGKRRADTLELFEGSGYDEGYLTLDCGYGGWDDECREFLNDHPGFNVIMWSWCGQVGGVDIHEHYLDRMRTLESEYPDVTFVYMTGHLDGGPDDPSQNGVLRNNNAIRDYCRANRKVLFDFADIEKYNLDGEYFGDRNLDDGCNYEGGNWAIEWQNSHIEDTDWYDCGAAHSESLNANQKAYAVWWLWARIAGWED